MRPAPHGHRPANARKSCVLPVPGAPRMSTRSPLFTTTLRFLEHIGVRGGNDLEVLDRDLAGLALGVVDAAFVSRAARGWRSTAWRKFATRSKVARQSAMALKLSMNHRSEDCAWVKAPAAIIRPPKDTLPLKYRGAATRMGATIVTQPKPAVTQVRLAWPMTMRRVARRALAKMQLDAAPLVRLALGQGNVVDVLVDAHEGEAQIGFARIALRIAADEAPADPVAQERAGARVDESRPTP